MMKNPGRKARGGGGAEEAFDAQYEKLENLAREMEKI